MSSIDPKSAAQLAIDYVREVYGEDNVSEPLLEEIELTTNRNTWKITVSFMRKAQVGMLKGLNQFKTERVYKLLELDAESGEIRSMKIRGDVRNA